MAIHPLAGQPAPLDVLIDVPALEHAYHDQPARPERSAPARRLRHQRAPRHAAWTDTFTEAHILAITQAICDYRRAQGIDGPLFLGKDTHALSGPAQRTALEVLAAEGVETILQRDRRRDARRRSSRTPSSFTIAAAPSTGPTASSSRRRTTRRPTAASSTTRPTAARPTPTSRRGSRIAPTPCSRPATPRSSACRSPGRSGRPRPMRSISSLPTSPTWPT